MRREQTLEFGHITLRVHEPTMEGIRSILGRDDVQFDPLSFLAGTSEIHQDLILMFTDASPETLKQLTLSEFMAVLDAIKDLLSPFLQILELLGAVAGYLQGVRETTLTKRSAS